MPTSYSGTSSSMLEQLWPYAIPIS